MNVQTCFNVTIRIGQIITFIGKDTATRSRWLAFRKVPDILPEDGGVGRNIGCMCTTHIITVLDFQGLYENNIYLNINNYSILMLENKAMIMLHHELKKELTFTVTVKYE